MHQVQQLVCWVFLVHGALSSSVGVSKRVKKVNLIRGHLGKFRNYTGVRLVGGSNGFEGNVEVFHSGRWGSVCDDEWDIREATVVCRQLGFERAFKATHSSQFGLQKSKFWLDNCYCEGHESRLSGCRHDDWGAHDCGADEVAGVICSQPEKSTTPRPAVTKPQTTNLQKLLGNIQVRLKGGRTPNEGRLELRTKSQPRWGLVCGHGWSLLEASVVCRQLGLGFALASTQSPIFSGDIGLELQASGIECRGNETNLQQCLAHRDLQCDSYSANFAGVVCTKRLADLRIDGEELMRTSYLEDRQLYFLQCAMEENCLASSAYELKTTSDAWHLEFRRLLRFTAKITNIGTEEFRPALPKHLWQFHQCHMHYHSMEVFATFDVLTLDGRKVAEGHKASFCLEDNQCGAGVSPGFACANYGDQGISVNCSDIYKHTIDCQWVDITDVNPGIYLFKVAINPEFKVPEMSFENNAVLCNMYYSETLVKITNCQLTRP